MNKEQMAALAVRLFAVFLVVYTLRYATSLIAFVNMEPPDQISATFIFLVSFSPLLVAILLWCFPLTIASLLIPKFATSEGPKPLGEVELQIVAFSILGLWVLASAIPDAFYWVTYVYRLKSVGFGNSVELTPHNVGGIVSTIAEIVLGMWLLLGSKGLVGIIRRLRHAGN